MSKKELTFTVTNGNIAYMKPDKLIKWRADRGLNQSDLGAMLGVTKACISRWESGKRHIPSFLHLALKCLKVKKGGSMQGKTKKRKEVKK
jgi:predicted transcriptional regulator